MQECVAGAYHDEDEDVLCESGGSANVSCHFAAFHAEIPRVFEVLVFCGSLLFNFAGRNYGQILNHSQSWEADQ